MAHLKRYINRERGSKKERERGTEKGERGTEKGERGTEKGETVAPHFQPILSTNIFSFENRRVTTSLSLSLSLSRSFSLVFNPHCRATSTINVTHLCSVPRG